MRRLLRAAVLSLALAVGTAGAGSGYDNVTAMGEASGGPPGAGPGSTPRRIHCGDGSSQLTSCLSQLPDILRKSGRVGIPSSKEDLDASCSAFKMGMGCVDEYSRACMSAKDREILVEQVSGANFTFRFLCDDKKFQGDFLRYASCFKGMSHDWDSCADQFMMLVREEMKRKNASEQSRMLELCCAKFGFIRCVYIASRNICRKEEAIFLNRIAEQLSVIGIYSPVCRDLDMATVCVAAVARPLLPLIPLLPPLLMAAVSLQPRRR